MVNIFSEDTFLSVSLFRICMFLLETTQIQTPIVFYYVYWSGNKPIFYIFFLDHSFCNLMKNRTSTSHTTNILHWAAISISDPYSYRYIFTISYCPIISKVCTCSCFDSDWKWSIEYAGVSESFRSISFIRKYLIDEKVRWIWEIRKFRISFYYIFQTQFNRSKRDSISIVSRLMVEIKTVSLIKICNFPNSEFFRKPHCGCVERISQSFL